MIIVRLSPVGTHYSKCALNYTRSADMTAVVPLMRCNDLAAYYVDRMTKAWVPLALTDKGLICALLLAACRHLYEHCQQAQQQQFAQLAAQYKLTCVRSLREAISSELFFSDATITKAVMLAYDEVRTEYPQARGVQC